VLKLDSFIQKGLENRNCSLLPNFLLASGSVDGAMVPHSRGKPISHLTKKKKQGKEKIMAKILLI
jgi:hypothetical protein